MRICPNCGSQQSDEADFCDECGARLGEGAASAPAGAASAQPTPAAPGPVTCPECGMAVVPGEPFCDNCGAALDTAAPGSQPQAPAPVRPSPVAAPDVEQGGPLICPNCGVELEPGSNFCDMCGAPVGGVPPTPWAGAEPPVQEPHMPPAQEPYVPSAQPIPASEAPAAVHERFVVQGTNATLPFPPGGTEFIVGRADPVSGVFPQIDLTDHGGDEGGVSRQHARISVQGAQVFIEDLNSTNFTYVNQQRLTPGHPQPLEEGDEIRLGRVRLTFHR